MKIISFSLWGNNPKYIVGLRRNLELMSKVYTGWKAAIYWGNDIHKRIRFETMHGFEDEIIYSSTIMPFADWRGMFWRFEPASDSNCEAMISRDCDSRLNLREKEAVDEWLASDKGFHIMRDHPWHGSKILGGMWGVKKGVLSDMVSLMSAWNQEDRWQTDQDFLNAVVYPRVKDNSMVHDPFFEQKPFPSLRNDLEFVGQSFDENDLPVVEHQEVLRRYLKGRGEVVRLPEFLK